MSKKNLIKITQNTIATPNFIAVQAEEQPLLISMNCIGDSLATAAFVGLPTGFFFRQVRVNAKFIDSGNFAIALSYSQMPDVLSNTPIEYTIFADGPNGDAVTVFVATGAFVDGSTSISIPCGTGKIISDIHGFVTPVWGVIG